MKNKVKSIFDGVQDINHVRYISHRGFQPMAPANSLPSFEYAGLLRQWAIETDVRETKDGVLVCCHDATVDAAFNGTGAIEELTWKELSLLQMNCGNRLNCFTREQKQMPLFTEYLAICKRFRSVPFIELKTDSVGKVLGAVRNSGLEDGQVAASDCSLDRLIEVRRCAKDMFVHWIFGNERRLDELARLGFAGMSWKVDDPLAQSLEKIKLSHDAGLRVCLRAADSLEAVRFMLGLGLDYLPSNCMHNLLPDEE